jgi:PAS domain S-box-containing protein
MPRRRLPLLTLLIGLACTLVVAAALWRTVEGLELERVGRTAERARGAVQDRMNTQAGLLESGAGLFAGGGPVSRETFARFVARLNLNARYPGVQGIGYAEVAPTAERPSLDARVRAAWGLDLPDRGYWTDTPAPPAAGIAPDAPELVSTILYLEPRDARNLAAVGFDMFSEPVRRDAMRRARDSGLPAVTERVRLVQEIDGRPQPGVLMYVPVYEGGAVPAGVEDRRARLRGFVYSPIRLGDFLDASLASAGSPGDAGGDISVYDAPAPGAAPDAPGTAPDEARLLVSRGVPPDLSHARWTTAAAADRRWTLLAAPSAGWRTGTWASARWLPAGALAAGALVSLLLWRLAAGQAAARERAEAATLEARRDRDRARTQARVLESMAEGVSLCDARGVIEYTNPAEDAMFGYAPGELLGRPVTDLNDLPPEENARVVAAVIAQLDAAGLWEGEWRNRRKDATTFWTRARITRLDLADGPHYVCVHEDVTGRKADEERIRVLNAELRARVAELETLLDVLPVGVFIGHDPACERITCNAAGSRMLGLPHAGNPGKTGPAAGALPFRVFRDGVELEPHELPMQKAARLGVDVAAETIDILRADGTFAHLYEHAAPLRDERGAVRGCVGVFVDMTELRRAADAVRHSEEQLRLVIDHLPVLVAYIGADGRYRLANRYYETYLGVPAPDLIGRRVEDVIGPAAYANVRGHLDAALAGTPATFSTHMRYTDGREKDIIVSYVPHESGGRVLGCVALVRDVTEERAAERDRLFLAEASAALATSDSLESTLETIARLAVPHFADWCVVDLVDDPADPAGSLRRAAVGHVDPAKLALAEEFRRRYPPRPDAPGGVPRVARTGEAELVPVITDDMLVQGAEDPEQLETLRGLGLHSYMAVPLTAKGRTLGVLTFIAAESGRTFGPRDLDNAADLGRRIGAALDAARLAQQKEETEARFRTMADSAPVLIWMADPRGVAWVNRAWLDFTGLPMDAQLGQGWLDAVHADDRPLAAGALRQALEGRRGARFTHRLRRADGAERVILAHAVPLDAPPGSPPGAIASCVDVTDMEEARRTLEAHGEALERTIAERTTDLERSHRRLRHAERLASLGTLAAGIGHDLGNLLLPMRVRLDSMRQKAPGEIADDVAAVEKGAEYLAQLAHGLRLLARDPMETAPAAERTLLSDWWPQVEGLLKNALPRGVELASRLPDGLPPVRLGAAGLTQAVFNLVQNAGDAMRARGRGTVTVWAEQGDGATVRLGVSDDGPGMTTDVLARCLEPFFTTKARGLSTGMGLSLVSGVVRRAGGEVDVRSTPGRGATFTLTLPVAADEPERQGPALRAAVTLADARTAAFVRTVAQELGLRVETVPAAEAPPSAPVWVADASVSPDAVRAFLHGDPARRIIRVGSVGTIPGPAGAPDWAGSGGGAAGGEEHSGRSGPREWRVPGGLRPLALRRAIGEATADLGAGDQA